MSPVGILVFIYFIVCNVLIKFFYYYFRSEGIGKRGDQWTEILSWEPRAFLYHGFLVCVLLFQRLDNMSESLRVLNFIY